jgi:hypothetical protein
MFLAYVSLACIILFLLSRPIEPIVKLNKHLHLFSKYAIFMPWFYIKT